MPGGPTARPRERAAERGGRARRAAPRRSSCVLPAAARRSPAPPRRLRRRAGRRLRRSRIVAGRDRHAPGDDARRDAARDDLRGQRAPERADRRLCAAGRRAIPDARRGLCGAFGDPLARRAGEHDRQGRQAALAAESGDGGAACRARGEMPLEPRPAAPRDLPAERQRAQRAGDSGAALARARGLELAGEPAVAAVGELARPARADPEAGRDVVEPEAQRPQQHGGALPVGKVGQRLLHRPQRLACDSHLVGRRTAAGEPVVERRRRCANGSQLAPVEPVPHDAGDVAGGVVDRRRGPPRELEPRLLVRLVGRLVEVVEGLLAGPPRPRDEPPPRRRAQPFEVPLRVQLSGAFRRHASRAGAYRRQMALTSLRRPRRSDRRGGRAPPRGG